jgi:hypothetical protein
MGESPDVMFDVTPALCKELAEEARSRFERGITMIRTGVTPKGGPLEDVVLAGFRVYAMKPCSGVVLMSHSVLGSTGVYYAQCRILDLEAQIERLRRGQGN